MGCLAVISAVVAAMGIVGMYLDFGDTGYRLALFLLALGMIGFVVSVGAMFVPQE